MIFNEIYKKPFEFVLTALMHEHIENNPIQAEEVRAAAEKFALADFGEISPEDAAANLSDINARSGHAIGRYKTTGGDIYINLDFNDSEPTDRAMIMYVYEY